LRSALVWAVLLAGCQQLDTSASRGLGKASRPNTPMTVDHEQESTPTDAGAPPTSDPPAADGCDPVRAQARTIREANCAPCHQAPAKEGNFYFVLDDDVLVKAVSATGQRFIVPGAPEDSRLFRRVAAGEMPPKARMQRPTPDDVALLRRWITRCLTPGGGGAPDAAAPAAPDTGTAPDPADGCGKAGQVCCGANACEGGGCCVLGQCRASGQACGGEDTGGIDDGLPGTCMDGTCRKGAESCGGVGQPCCGESGSCTASHAG
jgi:hypothetical protein